MRASGLSDDNNYDYLFYYLYYHYQDSKEFEALYDELMTYLKVAENWVAIEEELKQRNVGQVELGQLRFNLGRFN